jgi:hypothetical protein
MKNKNLLIIGAVVIAAIFFFKKKKTTPVLPIGPILPGGPVLPTGDINLHPIDMLEQKFSYPEGIYEGMRAIADYGDGTQYLIQDGKKYGITFEQWQNRGFDPGITVKSSLLDLIPDGGLLNNGA